MRKRKKDKQKAVYDDSLIERVYYNSLWNLMLTEINLRVVVDLTPHPKHSDYRDAINQYHIRLAKFKRISKIRCERLNKAE